MVTTLSMGRISYLAMEKIKTSNRLLGRIATAAPPYPCVGEDKGKEGSIFGSACARVEPFLLPVACSLVRSLCL